MEFDLNASMTYADYGHLDEEVRKLEEGGIDSFHIDIMDGRFVPNFAMSLNDLRCIASVATKPLDVHLMIEHPNEHIGLFLQSLRKGDTVYIHPEAEYHPSTTLQKIIDAGMIPGIAINPGTSVETIIEMLRIVKKVLIMAVNPGEDQALFQTCVERKITKLISLMEDMEFDIYLDGACDVEKIQEFAPKGVKGFVLDSELLFGKEKSYSDILHAIRQIRYGKSIIDMDVLSFKTNENTKVG